MGAITAVGRIVQGRLRIFAVFCPDCLGCLASFRYCGELVVVAHIAMLTHPSHKQEFTERRAIVMPLDVKCYAHIILVYLGRERRAAIQAFC